MTSRLLPHLTVNVLKMTVYLPPVLKCCTLLTKMVQHTQLKVTSRSLEKLCARCVIAWTHTIKYVSNCFTIIPFFEQSSPKQGQNLS